MAFDPAFARDVVLPLAQAAYAVMDGNGSVQLPPDVRAQVPALTRFIVEHDDQGIHLRPEHDAEETP